MADQISNVRSAAYCTIVRLLNQCFVKLHDIQIDGVYDSAPTSPYMDKGIFAVRVGDTRLYGERHSTKEETYNIQIKNVFGAGEYVLSLAGSIDNLTLDGIQAAEGTPMLLDRRISE